MALRNTIVFTASVLAISATSCGKDDDKAVTGFRGDAIPGVWTTDFNAKDINDNKVLDENETAPIDFATHSYVNDGNGTVVGKINGQQSNYAFKWKLVANDQALLLTTLAGTDSVYIESITSKSFVVKYMNGDTLRWVGLKR